jgi:hypothetical protein
MGYNASYDNYSQMGSPKASMQSMKRSSSEPLMIVNFFFGMSESEDAAIIFSKFLDLVKDGNSGSQSLMKTQVISLSAFLAVAKKSPKNKFNPISREEGVLRTTDYFVTPDFFVDHLSLAILSSFYHKRHGIFIKTYGEIDQQRALDSFGN